MLRKDFLSRPIWLFWFELLMLLLVGVLLAVSLRGLGAWGGVLSTFLLIGGVLGVSHWVFFLNGLVVSLAPMLGAFGSIYLVLSVYNFFSEEKRSAEIRDAFQHYISPAIVEQILGDPEALVLGGEKKNLTVLFADIRNFTSITEDIDPQDLTQLLNDHFTAMTDIIFEEHGLLDKFMGDALMAVYGAPIESKEHASQACRSAAKMLNKVTEFNESGRLLRKLNVGIGITTGDMIVGNMGSKDIFDYTVIGDIVNLGARIEKLNKIYKTSILLNSETYEQAASQVVARELDLIRVRGRAAPEKIFELFGAKGDVVKEKLDLAELWREGVAQYRACHWDRAEQLFSRINKLYPEDYPSEIYLKRCTQFKKHPPPADWDGVFSLAV